MMKNIIAGAIIHAGDGGYQIGNQKDHDAFVKARNQSLQGSKVKTVQYKNHNLATSSQAYELWETWKKTGKEADKLKLDVHLREVDERAKNLVECYK